MGEDKFSLVNIGIDWGNMVQDFTMQRTTDNTVTNAITTSATTTGNLSFEMPIDVDVVKMILGNSLTEYSICKGVNIPAFKNYTIYNDRVIKVDFVDGTFTKCVCDDEFDFYTGLAFCLFKRMLGDDGHKLFNRMMRAAMKTCDRIDMLHEQEAEEEKRIKAKRRKEELKRAAKAAKKRQEQVTLQSDAMLDALRKFKAQEKECRE